MAAVRMSAPGSKADIRQCLHRAILSCLARPAQLSKFIRSVIHRGGLIVVHARNSGFTRLMDRQKFSESADIEQPLHFPRYPTDRKFSIPILR